MGIADKLREAGAETVNLYVSHGIFSRGISIPYIDRVFTTDSYQLCSPQRPHFEVIPWL